MNSQETTQSSTRLIDGRACIGNYAHGFLWYVTIYAFANFHSGCDKPLINPMMPGNADTLHRRRYASFDLSELMFHIYTQEWLVNLTEDASMMNYISSISRKNHYNGWPRNVTFSYVYPGYYFNIKTVFSKYGILRIKIKRPETILSLLWGSQYFILRSTAVPLFTKKTPYYRYRILLGL